MCTLLRRHIPKLQGAFREGEELRFEIHRAPHNDPGAARLILVGINQDKGLPEEYDYEGSLCFHRVGHRDVRALSSSTTWSCETLKTMRSWLKDCVLSHARCRQPVQATKRLPRRLLDVMPTAASRIRPMEDIGFEMFDLMSLENSRNVHIISTGDLPPDTAYFTLSHRWRDPPSILLSKETAFLLAEDISPYLLKSSEAATFRHAIHATRALGFRYLWIDALCITQDDELEKTDEIMHMDDIYFNCTLNISAIEAQVHRGLIFDRDLLSINPCRVNVTVPHSQAVVHLELFPDRIYLESQEEPLGKRAWVFQERTLAPRIIHFARDQVFWECRSIKASEVVPQGVSSEMDNRLDRSIGLTSEPYHIESVKSRWYQLVEEYSHTSVTFVTDHLLAVSAVAKRYGLAMHLEPSDYVAGMWKEDLPLSMLWSQRDLPGRDGPQPTSIGLETQHAPSWSWASIMTPIQNINLSMFDPVAQVMSIHVARLSPNYFDGATSCRLSIRGPMCKFRRQLQDGIYWIQVAQQTCFRELGRSDPTYIGMRIYWDTSRCLAADDFFFLHVATRTPYDEPDETGLILRRTAEHATYARAGVFSMPVEEAYTGSKLEEVFNGRLDTLDTDDYLEVDVGGRYAIDIV